MTSATTHADVSPETATDPGGTDSRPGVRRAAGLALLATPVLLAGGIATVPPGEDGVTTTSLLASLGATPWLTTLSAGLLHYSWVLFALGVLATPVLVRGRGRTLASVVAVAMSFSSIQISGLLVVDWYGMELARSLPLEQAASIDDAVGANPWMAVWIWSGKVVGFAGILLVTLALAYGRAVSWWLVALPFLGTAVMIVLPMVLGPLALLGAGLGTLISAAPLFVVGNRLLRLPPRSAGASVA